MYPNPAPMSNFRLLPVGGPHPEDVLIDPSGALITGLQDGRLMRVVSDEGPTEIANTGGRPLGLTWLPDGRVLVCDTQKGLLAVSIAQGQIETLVPRGTHGLHVCNNPTVAEDGRIFFSDSSQRNSEGEATKDIVDGVATGRLLCRYPDGRVEELLDDLLFANGVLVAPDQSFVLVAQTGRACIDRLWLTGEKAGQRDKFATDLPGLPDNLLLGSDGLIWLALVAPFSDELKQLLVAPRWLRYVVARLPQRLLPKQSVCCLVMAFDMTGRCIHYFEGDSTQFHLVTGVCEHNGTVYMGTIQGDAVACFEKEPASTTLE